MSSLKCSWKNYSSKFPYHFTWVSIIFSELTTNDIKITNGHENVKTKVFNFNSSNFVWSSTGFGLLRCAYVTSFLDMGKQSQNDSLKLDDIFLKTLLVTL